MLDFSEIKLGSVVNYENQPCVIVKCEFLRMQQRKPVKKCVMKNLTNGRSLDYSFKSGESVEEADLRREKANFMYEANGELSFMVESTFETIELSQNMLGDKKDYLKEGLEVLIVYFNDKPIAIELPVKISFKIIQADPPVKGNSSGGVTKDAIIETGKKIRVPLFISEGEEVIINTTEDEYVGRLIS
jgi:elongation factor P